MYTLVEGSIELFLLCHPIALFQGGDLADDSNKAEPFTEMAIIDIWFRTDKAMVMYLSDGTLQVRYICLLYHIQFYFRLCQFIYWIYKIFDMNKKL